MLLELKHVHGGYGRLEVVSDVSLVVDEGDFCCVLGSNNAGKSTLINLISGAVRTTSGQIVFDGQNITSMAAHERVRRGLVQVPEGRQLFPQMTVRDNLLLGAVGDRSRRGHDESLLDEVHALFPKLRERAEQWAGSLSGGEQQMVAIARGMMARPKLLMLDEPSLGLAPLIVEDIFRALDELNRRGVTILLVEQNLTVSLQHARYAYVVERGAVVLDGPASELVGDEEARRAYLGM